MALFYEVEISQDKPVLYAIQKLYGIGHSEAFQFCNELGIGRDVIVADLAKDEWQTLIQSIEKHDVRYPQAGFKHGAYPYHTRGDAGKWR